MCVLPVPGVCAAPSSLVLFLKRNQNIKGVSPQQYSSRDGILSGELAIPYRDVVWICPRVEFSSCCAWTCALCAVRGGREEGANLVACTEWRASGDLHDGLCESIGGILFMITNNPPHPRPTTRIYHDPLLPGHLTKAACRVCTILQ